MVAPQAFIYVRHPLTAEADLTRLVRTLLRELKRQVLDNVVLTVQTDFDVETGAELHLAQIAALPALVLVGPELSDPALGALRAGHEGDEGAQFSTPPTGPATGKIEIFFGEKERG